MDPYLALSSQEVTMNSGGSTGHSDQFGTPCSMPPRHEHGLRHQPRPTVGPQTQTWPLTEARPGHNHNLRVVLVPHIYLLLTAIVSPVLPLFVVHKPLGFTFSPIFLPYIPLSPSLHHILANMSSVWHPPIGQGWCLRVFLLVTLGHSGMIFFFFFRS